MVKENDELSFKEKIKAENYFKIKEKLSLQLENDKLKARLEVIFGPYAIIFLLIMLGVSIWLFTSDMGIECVTNIKKLIVGPP